MTIKIITHASTTIAIDDAIEKFDCADGNIWKIAYDTLYKLVDVPPDKVGWMPVDSTSTFVEDVKATNELLEKELTRGTVLYFVPDDEDETKEFLQKYLSGKLKANLDEE